MQRLSRISARLRRQEGFTMIVTVLVLMVVLLMSAAAYSAVGGDLRSGTYSQGQKQAYAAARAGIDWYRAHLAKDPSYWTSCTAAPSITNGPLPIENAYSGTGTRPWRSLTPTGTGAGPQFVVDLIPVAPATACDPNDAAGSMIDPTTGTFRIRVTGRASANAGAPKRSVVATFRRRGFLDFIYFTDLEDRDPALWADSYAANYMSSNSYTATNPDMASWIKTNCALHWWEGRSTGRYSGTATRSGGGTANIGPLDLCQNGDIQFANADVVAGPFHSNDGILTCDSPTFGRTTADDIEISAPTTQQPFRPACSATGIPNWVGTYRPGSPLMTLPPNNGSLAGDVTPGYKFTGQTTIVLGTPAGQMTVSNPTMGLSKVVMNQPANGVIYVANATCGISYDQNNPYPSGATGCGDLYVSGTYSQNLTLTAEKDIIVNGAVTKSGDRLLGLIANNYVRVWHPITGSGGTCQNDPSYIMPNPLTIEAAILTVNHSFTVDNYWCKTLGTLNVVGAIAQKFRGIVGQGSNGYIKNYQYDNRFRYRSPPNFLDPLQTGWRVVRESEQTPAT